MSWNCLIEPLLNHTKSADGTQHITKLAIIGENGMQWTDANDENLKDKVLKMSHAEATKIAGALTSKDYSEFQTAGVHLNNVKFNYIRNEGNYFIASLKNHGAITGELCEEKKAVVVAFVPDANQVRSASTALDKMMQYLKNA